jgi:hypothetical protein
MTGRSTALTAQDPVLFSGTLKEFVDPSGSASEEEVWDTLRRCRIDCKAKEMGGLTAQVAEAGSNMSLGERQLLVGRGLKGGLTMKCIARVVTRNSRIVILDEVRGRLSATFDMAGNVGDGQSNGRTGAGNRQGCFCLCNGVYSGSSIEKCRSLRSYRNHQARRAGTV